MKNTLPGIFEKAFPGIFDPDNNGKPKHAGLSDDFFYQLVQNAQECIIHAQLFPEMKLDYVSPSSYKITGYTTEEFYADPCLLNKCFYPEDFHIIVDHLKPDFVPLTEPCEIRWIRKDGVTIWIEYTVNYTKDKEGRYVSCQIITRDITERKNADENLLENQIFTQSLLEHAPHATVVINPDTSIKYVNPAWEQLNGWTLAEVIGFKAPYPWWPGEDTENWLKIFLENLKQTSGTGELPSIKKNGERYWIALNWAAVQKNGETDYFLINSVDITERKKAEKALQDSEAKFSRAFQASPDLMAITTIKDGKFIEVNESFVRASGYTREEAIGHTVEELNSWADKEDRARLHQIMKEQGRVYNEEYRFRSKSGEIRTLLFSMEQIKVGDGPCYISISNDITERKKAEAALQESEEKFSKVYSSSPNAICLMSVKERKFLEANESFYRFTGYSAEEIYGHNHIDLNLCEKEEDRDYILKALHETGQVFNKRISCRTKSGLLRAGLFSADTIEIGGEKCYIIVITDIAEQEKTEAALIESEEKFSKAFSSSPTAISLFNIEDNKFLDINESFTHFTGYNWEEVIDHTPDELNLWVSNEEMENMSIKLRETGGISNERIQSRMKSGEIRTGLFAAQTFDINGKKHMILSITDITEQVKAEEALRDSEEKFAKAFRGSPEIIAITTLKDGRYVDVNESYTHYTGYTREELIGKTTKHINIWANESELIERRRIITERGRVTNKEYQFRTKSGETRTWLYSAEPINISGEPCLMSASMDITERKQMEQELANEAIRRRILIEQSSDGIVILDENGKVYDVNWRFAEMLGYTMKEASELYIWDWNKDNTREELIKLLKEVDSDGDHFTTRHTRKDGTVIEVDISTNGATFAGQKLIFCVCRDITERNQIEKALRESEEKFSLAFSASPISLAITRASDGVFLEVNESFLRDKGYTREEIIGKSSRKLNLWASPEELKELMAELKARGRVHNKQMQYRTKSGEIRVGLVSEESINIGNEPCTLVLNNDITQQKQAQEQLRMLSSVTKQVTDSTIITDPEFGITFMNQAALDMFGYSFEEVKGKNLSLFNETSPTEETKKAVRDTIAAGKVYTCIIPKKCKDGTIIMCDCRISPMYDEKGNICSLIDVQRDITKQKDVEAKLQEHKKLIDSILATMPEGVLVIDNHDRIILANKALYEILHLNSRTAKNKPLSEVLPLDQYFNIQRAVAQGNNKNNTLEFRYNLQGTEKIIYCVIVKMSGERTLITFSDVSREREEEEKLYLTDRLASIGEMAAGLAHELNNPLTGILALSQLLVSGDIPKEQKEDLECIYSEAKRAAGIVKNVLLFARNKADETGRACVNDVVRDVLRLREYEERSSNIKVVTELEENLADVLVDKGQLQQVFLNMISNAEAAIKEANRPGILTVTTQRTNNHINIHFSDNGCGIKKQVMPRIFDPFFTTKEVGKGTGLGLSICYSIVVKHGGKITVKSQVNEGTTFTIRLPVVS